MTIIHRIVYLSGIAACAIQGIDKFTSAKRPLPRWSTLLIVLISCYGGGLERDLFLLRVHPFLFTLEAIPEVVFALIVALFMLSIWGHHPSAINRIVFILDAASLGAFISCGVDKAIKMNASTGVVFLSGFLTALGGGICASIICGASIGDALSKGLSYKLVAAIGVALYMDWINYGYSTSDAQLSIIIYTLVMVFAFEIHFRSFAYEKAKNVAFSRAKHWDATPVLYFCGYVALHRANIRRIPTCHRFYRLYGRLLNP